MRVYSLFLFSLVSSSSVTHFFLLPRSQRPSTLSLHCFVSNQCSPPLLSEFIGFGTCITLTTQRCPDSSDERMTVTTSSRPRRHSNRVYFLRLRSSISLRPTSIVPQQAPSVLRQSSCQLLCHLPIACYIGNSNCPKGRIVPSFNEVLPGPSIASTDKPASLPLPTA